MSRLSRILFAALLVLPAAAQAAELQIERAWSRASIGAGSTGAIFMEVTNPGASPAVLTGAETMVAERAELHTHEMADGVMRMREVPSVAVPAGGAVAFEPGGYHVMLFGMTRELAEGDSFEVVLQSAAGERFTAEVMVMPPSFMGHGGMGHEGMDSGEEMMQPEN